LIIVSRTLTEPKTALAGVMLEISFARFRASIVTFNVEITPFRAFGRWEFAAIVENRGSREEALRKSPNPDTYERQFYHETPRVR
jgi:hypothetical protein